jgi:hypothetical protein
MRTPRLAVVAVVALVASAHPFPAGAAVSTVCARLGDAVGGRLDEDTFELWGNDTPAQVTLRSGRIRRTPGPGCGWACRAIACAAICRWR